MTPQRIRGFFSFFSQKQGTIISAAGVIMVTVFLSRVLGLVRDRMLAGYFSVDELGVYFAAFRLPDALFQLLVMGALSTAFIPVFTKLLVHGDKKDAFSMANSVINLTVIAVCIFMIPLIIFTRQFSNIIAPGFSGEELDRMVMFTRIMLLGQLLPMIIGNFFTGMLQSFQRFLLAALAPVVYNLGIILGIITLSSQWGLMSAVWGVVIGAGLFMLIQLPLILSLGYRYSPLLQLKNKETREVLKLTMPRMFGLGVSQIETTVDLILASYLGAGSITIFYFAQHLQQLPIGLFGATFAQAALPTLALEGAKKDLEAFKSFFLASLHQILFLVLPASMMLIVLRIPIVRLVFGTARFDWDATVLTGQTLSFFAVSIFAQSLVLLFTRGFYALYDTKTPVIIGMFSVVLNTLLSVLFVSFLHLPVWSLAISTSTANILHVCLLFFFLQKKIAGFNLRSLCIPPLKMFIASAVTGVFLYIPMKLLDQLVFDTTRVFDLILLTSVAAISGLSVYIFLAWFLDIDEVGTFFRVLQKMKRAPRVFFTQSPELTSSDQPSIS